MKQKNAFYGWLRSRLIVAVLLLLVIGIYSLLFFLYGRVEESSLYALVLSLAVIACFAVADYRRYAARHQLLCRVRDEITFMLSHLPSPASQIEEDYQTLLGEIFRDKEEQFARTQAEMNDLIDYYTLWAHQIKTPIAAMRLLLQSGTQDTDALQSELLRIEQYVEMVLSYLRLGSESNDFVIRTCSLDEIIRKAVRKYSRIFIMKKLSLRYEPTGATVLTDEKWLVFVLEQLLSNALKYTKSGSITIEEKEGILSISDTGIGIAAEDVPRVFDKGYTGYNGRADQKATGIGLFLCREICKKLGNTISIASTAGSGTVVSVDLRREELVLE